MRNKTYDDILNLKEMDRLQNEINKAQAVYQSQHTWWHNLPCRHLDRAKKLKRKLKELKELHSKNL